jgi:DNA (cytosine-5)-methyltransferase 1
MKEEWILKEGVMAQAFPVSVPKMEADIFGLDADLVKISAKFNKGGKNSPFQNTGVMVNGSFWTMKTTAEHDGPFTTLGDVLLPDNEVSKDLYVVNGEHAKWEYLKGAKNEKRYNKAQDFWYTYNEGPMVFPDALNNASRTIITGEGGRSPSRFKHVIRTKKGRLRRLAPIELERLNMFPDEHTEGASDVKRAFFMGNALVVGVVERIGEELVRSIQDR